MPEESFRYEIRPSNETTFALEVFKSGFLAGKRHVFFFEKYEGEVFYHPAAPEKSSARFTVESDSITCRDTWVSPKQKKHILSVALNDMLAVNQFQRITFTSSAASQISSNLYEVQGDLAIRGVTRPAALHVALKTVGTGRFELDGDARISLRTFALKPPSALLGLIGTKDEMQVRFLVWAERAKAGGTAAR